jgi:hypothetical protein
VRLKVIIYVFIWGIIYDMIFFIIIVKKIDKISWHLKRTHDLIEKLQPVIV